MLRDSGYYLSLLFQLGWQQKYRGLPFSCQVGVEVQASHLTFGDKSSSHSCWVGGSSTPQYAPIDITQSEWGRSDSSLLPFDFYHRASGLVINQCPNSPGGLLWHHPAGGGERHFIIPFRGRSPEFPLQRRQSSLSQPTGMKVPT